MEPSERAASSSQNPQDVNAQQAAIAALRLSLGTQWEQHGAALTRWVERVGVTLETLEASIRQSPSGPVGGRMMFERLSVAQADAWLQAMNAPRPQVVERMLSAAQEFNQPLIVGWDTRGGGLILKLYLNASDASRTTRDALRSSLFPTANPGDTLSVVGLNLSGDTCETKIYQQSKAPPSGISATASEWFSRFETSGLVAGYVSSYVYENDRLKPRAWFAATRSKSGSHKWVEQLPGWSGQDVASATPFEPGQITSVGFSAESDRWTVYFRPPSARTIVWNLSSLMNFSDGTSEIGIYVEPKDEARKSYAVVGSSAISFRVREGAPSGKEVCRLMDWVVQNFERLSNEPAESSRAPLLPPRPWHVVSTD